MPTIKVRRSYEKEGFKYPVFEYRPDWPYISVGFGDERDYLIENLSLLIASGMGIMTSLSAIKVSVKTRKMKKIISFVEESVNSGVPLWKSFEQTKFFPQRIISLIRAGEESGRLPEHLNLVTIQMQKDKTFRSRIRSALLYPGIVLALAFIVMLGGSWYILPNLVSLFDQAQSSLPIQTKILLWLGSFFKLYGLIAVPLIIILFVLIIYIFFFNTRSKFIGDFFLLRLGGIKTLIQGVEVGRFGYNLGALLQAGFQISEAFDSVKGGTNYRAYRKFYTHIQESVLRGETFRQAFESYKHSDRLIPAPMQQLIIAAEKSGRLSETLIKIGTIFEEKTDTMSRDLGIILEPIVLVIVGLMVGLVVSGIIGPIYGLSNIIK